MMDWSVLLRRYKCKSAKQNRTAFQTIHVSADFNLVLQHEAEYKSILSATKSGPSEKRLAAQFIPRFFKFFPHLSEQAIDAQTDLCEDEDVSVSCSVQGLSQPAGFTCLPHIGIFLRLSPQ